MDSSAFFRRLNYGRKFESRLVTLFTDSGYKSNLLEFKTPTENATNGDLDVWNKDNEQIRLEAKYTSKIALKSIERFTGSFYIVTPFNNSESPNLITSEKIYVIPRSSIISYADKIVKSGKTIKMKSGDIGIDLNLGQYITGFIFTKKVTLEKFIKDELVFYDT